MSMSPDLVALKFLNIQQKSGSPARPIQRAVSHSAPIRRYLMFACL